MRLTLLCVLLFTLICLPSFSQAQYLSYKQSLFGDMNYTRNGIEFQNFGTFWRNLLDEVSADEQAQSTLRASRNFNYAGQIFAIGGGGFLGYAAGLESDNKEVDDGIWIAAGVFTVSSIVCMIVAKYKLDKGFLIYNENNSRGGGISSGGFGFIVTPRKTAITYDF